MLVLELHVTTFMYSIDKQKVYNEFTSYCSHNIVTCSSLNYQFLCNKKRKNKRYHATLKPTALAGTWVG